MPYVPMKLARPNPVETSGEMQPVDSGQHSALLAPLGGDGDRAQVPVSPGAIPGAGSRPQQPPPPPQLPPPTRAPSIPGIKEGSANPFASLKKGRTTGQPKRQQPPARDPGADEAFKGANPIAAFVHNPFFASAFLRGAENRSRELRGLEQRFRAWADNEEEQARAEHTVKNAGVPVGQPRLGRRAEEAAEGSVASLNQAFQEAMRPSPIHVPSLLTPNRIRNPL